YVETTTPGMRGQSGGPIFDTAGRIYAMQSRTEHIPLGFEVGNQFMNIGMGVHGGTIRQVLDARKVDYLREEAPVKKMGRFFH
ncbi:MAG: serine protease, partial [archaeon]|nr:serine protease [archaeon]